MVDKPTEEAFIMDAFSSPSWNSGISPEKILAAKGQLRPTAKTKSDSCNVFLGSLVMITVWLLSYFHSMYTFLDGLRQLEYSSV